MNTLSKVAITLLLASPALGQQVTFKNHGKVISTFAISDLKKITDAQTLKVHDLNELADIEYKAYPVRALLDHVYGRNWEKEEEALFTCSDGYQPSLPMEVFKTGEGYFAFERVGSTSFSIVNKTESGKKVNVGPLYLIWKNTVDGKYWAYQLTTLDLTTFAESFPRLAPPDKGSLKAKKGFLAFRQNCIQCHSLNGDGGNTGPELNYPVNITEYYKEPMLFKWIDDPRSVRFRTAMPQLRQDLPDRTAVIKDIISYFKAMRDHKVAPKEKTP